MLFRWKKDRKGHGKGGYFASGSSDNHVMRTRLWHSANTLAICRSGERCIFLPTGTYESTGLISGGLPVAEKSKLLHVPKPILRRNSSAM